MSPGLLGYYFGTLMLAGVLPAAFILYGSRQRRSWAIAVGWTLALLILAGSFYGSFNAAHVVGLGMCIAASLAKPRSPTP